MCDPRFHDVELNHTFTNSVKESLETGCFKVENQVNQIFNQVENQIFIQVKNTLIAVNFQQK